jgi:OmpA-OmpF porin, OOP family
MPMRGYGIAAVVAVLGVAVAGGAQAAERPTADEIAARLMDVTPRAGQQVEEEWDRPEITCTPIEARGMYYDDDEPVARRPRLQMEVNFAFASAELTADAAELLAVLAEALNSPMLEGSRFLLVGHTDAVGSEEANLALSERRAEAVFEHLVARHGVAPERLRARGCGKAVLLVPGDPPSPRNRRVEVINAGP